MKIALQGVRGLRIEGVSPEMDANKEYRVILTCSPVSQEEILSQGEEPADKVMKLKVTDGIAYIQ